MFSRAVGTVAFSDEIREEYLVAAAQLQPTFIR